MPLFYFDIHDDGHPLPDRQGMQFDDVIDAQSYALQIAESFLQQGSTIVWATPSWTVEIRDERNAMLCSMRFQVSQPAG